jgi:hypothetical protein
MIVEQAAALHGPWPVGMTLFIFDDAYGWSATISRPSSEADNFYRTCTLDLIARLATEYDLDVPRVYLTIFLISRFPIPPSICVVLKRQETRYRKRPARRQSRTQESQKGENQDNCCRQKPKGGNVVFRSQPHRLRLAASASLASRSDLSRSRLS